MTRAGWAALGLMVAAAGGTSLLVAWRRQRDDRALRAVVDAEIEGGTDMGLRRAQALVRHLAIVEPGDAETSASLAFIAAALTVDFGVPLSPEAERAARRAAAGRPADDAVAAMALAARALLAAHAGDWAGASRLAADAAAGAPGMALPLYALGRVRALGGDLVGASRALEAALVDTPTAAGANVAWAEVRLDLGDGTTAVATLQGVLARQPDNRRARLLLDEAEGTRPAAPAASAAALDAACRPTPPASAFEASACDLAYARGARAAGRRAEALALALSAARTAPDEPRLLSRIAQLLAALGAVDRAAGLTARAAPLAGALMPALAWARLAVTLGRGRAGPLPAGPPPVGPDGRLLQARAALAAGGVAALAAALGRVDASIAAADPDLLVLRRLTGAAPAVAVADAPEDPARAYVDGLRARLAGDLPAATLLLARALAGHADACRAAGEYVATLRAQRRRPPAGAFAALREQNSGCVNLPAGP